MAVAADFLNCLEEILSAYQSTSETNLRMLAAFNAYRRGGGRSMNSEHHQQPMNHHHQVQPPTCHQQGADSREDHQTSSEEDFMEHFSMIRAVSVGIITYRCFRRDCLPVLIRDNITFMRVSISNDCSILSHPIGYNPIAWRGRFHGTFQYDKVGGPKDYNSLEAASTNKSTARAIQKRQLNVCKTKFLVDSSSGFHNECPLCVWPMIAALGFRKQLKLVDAFYMHEEAEDQYAKKSLIEQLRVML
ncbi:hypothetical protein C4D60_Mb06t08320 [Musa balbisiana]|uniref:Uncharacterized protein n=1 Tax=Musa balbisiana TaxID=52838 RepID=A0A4S8IM90_MUSBA|nr:hypothetical protein C4D60_Mb06t08320 [Musa balbisiana]